MTDYNMLSEFNKVFSCFYNTIGNNKLFGSKIPDGWFEINNNLIIIENKKDAKDKTVGLKQLINYYLTAKDTEEFKKFKNCYLILGCGINKSFSYSIYSTDNDKIKKTKLKLKDLKDSNYSPAFDIKEVHKFNQYLYDNGINLPKSQKTLFVSAILLVLKINPKFLINYDESDKGFIIADQMIKLIGEYYQDLTFANSFSFIKYNLNNEQLYYLINFLSVDVKNYGIDILKQFYNEFMIYDKNNDSQMGIVLTPHDIVELMVKELQIKPNESIADFCTGTGSFLIEAGKYTNKLIGCENGEERYSLAKCNFILKDLDYSHLYFNNCFNQQFKTYDHIILNPPFSCNSTDDGTTEDIYGWRSMTKEQKFVIYQLQHLKDGGVGCCIIPRNNFNNSTAKSNSFKQILLNNCQILKIINCNSKVFAPAANVECTICIFKKTENKIKEKAETEIIDYSDDGFTVKKNIRLKTSEPKPKSYKTNLKLSDDWNYSKPLDIPDNVNQLIALYNIDYNTLINKQKIMTGDYDVFYTDYIKIRKIKEWKQIKICDYFELLPPGKIDGNKRNTEEGIYNLVSTGQQNNGIIKNVNVYEYDGEANQYLTVAMYGTTGSTFYQKNKFIVNHNVRVLKPKYKMKEEEINLFALMINYYLTKKYSYSNGLSISKLNNEIINYPVFV